MKDNYSFNLGEIWFKLLHTPGHTLESTCYRLFDKNKKEFCIFSGDIILYDEIGRPDLAVSEDMTKEALAKMLLDSLLKIK